MAGGSTRFTGKHSKIQRRRRGRWCSRNRLEGAATQMEKDKKKSPPKNV